MPGSEKLSGVYAIIHQPSGRAYVGSSKDIFRRWRCHANWLNTGKHHAAALLDVWLSDGAAAFTFVVLEQCAPDALQEREQEWLDSFEEPLNASLNSSCPSLDPGVAAKIGAANKGRKNPAVAERNRLRTGIKHLYPMSQQARANMSAARRGRVFGPRDPSVGKKIAAALRGRPLSEERRRKISVARTGKPITEKMQRHLARLHALTRSDARRYRFRDAMRLPENRATQIVNHWSRSGDAAVVIAKTKATRQAKKEHAMHSSLTPEGTDAK